METKHFQTLSNINILVSITGQSTVKKMQNNIGYWAQQDLPETPFVD